MSYRSYKQRSKPRIIMPDIEVCIMSGNTKLGGIWNTSLPPVKSCSTDAPCYDKCYAMKAYRQYPDTREAWDRNYKLYQATPNEYFRQVEAFLSDVRPDSFRWLVAGDVVDMGYMTGVLALANRCSETHYCLFTKNYRILYELIDQKVYRPANLTILASGWPGHAIPDAIRENYRIAWMQDGTETRAPKNAIICQGSCIDCLKCYNPRVKRDVILPIH
jgi:hypothetical protein